MSDVGKAVESITDTFKTAAMVRGIIGQLDYEQAGETYEEMTNRKKALQEALDMKPQGCPADDPIMILLNEAIEFHEGTLRKVEARLLKLTPESVN